MKFIAIALLALSSLAHAVELDATEALLQTLTPGVYTGLTPDSSEACSVEIQQTAQGVLVIARKGPQQVTRSVGFGTVYRWNPGPRLFLSSDNFYREDVSEEVVFRTLAVDEARQYTVVSHQRTIGRDRVFNNQIECVINL
jgi:hypothetical protein